MIFSVKSEFHGDIILKFDLPSNLLKDMMQLQFLLLCLSLTFGFIFGSENTRVVHFDNTALHPARIVTEQNQDKKDFLASQNFLYYKQFDLKLKELQQLLTLLKLQSKHQKSGSVSEDPIESTTSTSSTTTSSMTEMKSEEQSKRFLKIHESIFKL